MKIRHDRLIPYIVSYHISSTMLNVYTYWEIQAIENLDT